MKKTGIAGVLGLALGATVTGAAWYTGKQAQSDLDQTLGQINGALQALGAWGGQAVPVIELMASERGVFSTTRRYRLTLAPAAGGRVRLKSSSLSKRWTTARFRFNA
ncbi:DUF945 family protein [Achromobacter spanius]|uniref:DUF945 family protein n=1 Tax=Achromobacter spanius TaxID=217203 RepID=UPI000F8F8B7C|nr:DUF945 family protein [Achromobacter spanius]AZS77073.1 DUF945 family protein [Achromobacter spanius]